MLGRHLEVLNPRRSLKRTCPLFCRGCKSVATLWTPGFSTQTRRRFSLRGCSSFSTVFMTKRCFSYYSTKPWRGKKRTFQCWNFFMISSFQFLHTKNVFYARLPQSFCSVLAHKQGGEKNMVYWEIQRFVRLLCSVIYRGYIATAAVFLGGLLQTILARPWQ